MKSYSLQNLSPRDLNKNTNIHKGHRVWRKSYRPASRLLTFHSRKRILKQTRIERMCFSRGEPAFLQVEIVRIFSSLAMLHLAFTAKSRTMRNIGGVSCMIYTRAYISACSGAWFSYGCPRIRRNPKGDFVMDRACGTLPIPVDLSLAIIAYHAVLSYRGS